MCFYVILLTKLFRFYKKFSLLQITYFTKAAQRGKLKLVMSLYIVKNEKCEDKTTDEQSAAEEELASVTAVKTQKY